MSERTPRQLDFEGKRHNLAPKDLIGGVVQDAWNNIPQELGMGFYIYEKGSMAFVCTEDNLSDTKRTFVFSVTESRYMASPQLIVDTDSYGGCTVTEVDFNNHWNFLEDYYPWEKVNLTEIADEFNLYVELLDSDSINQNLGGKKVSSNRLTDLMFRWGG